MSRYPTITPLAVTVAARALHAEAVSHIPGAKPLSQWDKRTQQYWESRARAALLAAIPYLQQGQPS